MKQGLNVIIAGVGGQGTLLASRLLGNAFISMGYDIKVSEVHGMSQRGGSVVTYVRAGEKVFSPIIERGEADIMLAFETLESARWLSHLKKGGKMIVNTQTIDPMPVITGAAQYPREIIQTLKSKGIDLTELDALALANRAGSTKAVNVVLIGLLAAKTDIPYQVWEKSVEETVPERFLQLNLKALKLGYEYL